MDGEDGKQCFEVVIRVSRLRFVVTFFCAILRLLSLGYLVSYVRRLLKLDFCFLKTKVFFLQLETLDSWIEMADEASHLATATITR